MGALDTVNAVVAGLKKVREVAKKIHDADLQNAIADLMLTVANLKAEVAELRENNLQLRREIEDLTKKQDVRSKVGMRDGVYYLRERVEGYSEGPFCPVCLDRDGDLITLRQVMSLNLSTRERTPAGWRCGNCKNSFD